MQSAQTGSDVRVERLIEWLRDAHAMEAQAESMLSKQASRIQHYPELKARIERIPLKERRIAWSKAIYGTFSPEEMAESARRIAIGAAEVEADGGSGRHDREPTDSRNSPPVETRA